jgi:hypothetical protein
MLSLDGRSIRNLEGHGPMLTRLHLTNFRSHANSTLSLARAI